MAMKIHVVKRATFEDEARQGFSSGKCDKRSV